ncbi:RteC domain-containing protein [Mucilaginibacter phyllosphaerae]|uniref:RteC protein n=1 Tax=Mucilaginibacter phyllosphaerae TaxID=1812349 RepID=A0A4Y8ADX8_9SPHI|nr:RteC domain-containing protein [Mucilaginibacter phyllosphaerae]MBB3971296.1 hypothetical protein [Mucilaginibacter phyllosphaerae]TEW66808.1 hypothetical protein E2R65_10355 [Mucilaginibacter phyllosphaerae]GGH12069.1 hypothetical protein GCM10007352_18640 [Mucilaginibacter phyllosphaerae]
MKTEFKKIKTELEETLLSDPDVASSAETIKQAATLIEDALSSIRIDVVKNGFEDEPDEIAFFKSYKPELLSLKIELIYRYNLKLNEPVGTRETVIKYYEAEIKSIQSFFRMNSFHYQYFKNNLTHMDAVYFVRNAGPLALPTDDINDVDPKFSTPMSLLFAKFKGYESVQQFSLQQISSTGNSSSGTEPKEAKENMRWTGDSINIVELAYGVWLTGQLNNGNASLNQIVKWLEINLHVNIGVVQRRFIEIERRKRLSPTKYIDQMRDTIRQKIDRGNS